MENCNKPVKPTEKKSSVSKSEPTGPFRPAEERRGVRTEVDDEGFAGKPSRKSRCECGNQHPGYITCSESRIANGR